MTTHNPSFFPCAMPHAPCNVKLKSANTGATLEFSAVRNQYCTVTFSSAALRASHQVWIYSGEGERFASLFVEMAEHWTGWAGAKTWASLEADFSLSCTSDSLGHITLEVEMVDRDSPEEWSTQFKIEVEAGQLETIAQEIQVLFNPIH